MRGSLKGTTRFLVWLVIALALIETATPKPLVAAPPAGLAVGDRAPDFELPVQGEDEYVRLSDLLRDGPVVVVVLRGYPGYQCALCNRQVSGLINRSSALASATGNRPRRVVLIYPGEEDGLERHAGRFLGSRRLPQPMVMLRDPDMKMVRSWGVRWDKRRETAYPSTFVIGAGSRVRWAKVSGSHAGRATVEEILKAVRE